MSIQVLADEVINQIAAGEVVERPSSVVKELLENALDAGATRVEVHIQDGGKELIRVIDNGSGIPQDSLELAVTRHATSKIQNMTDLEKIRTLGFRGEALASISSVSTLTLISRTPDSDFGYQLVVENGKRSSITKVGTPVGTEVRVEDLFSSVPARKKFLKSSATEAKYISQLVTSMALVHPAVSFRLVKDDKEVFRAPAAASLKERVQLIWGNDFFSLVMPVFFEHPYLEIEGFVGKPQISGKTANGWFFVNQRWVDDRALQAAVRDAYGGLLPPRGKPFFVIALKTPAHLVDVNVHPRKEEVKFASPAFVFNAVRSATQKALTGADMTPEVSFAAPSHQPKDAPSTHARPARYQPVSKGGGQPSYNVVADRPADVAPLPWELPAKSADSVAPTPVTSENFVVFQQVYIFDFSGDEIVIFDQHALHERVLFEKFKKAHEEGLAEGEIQALLLPQQVQLSPDELETFGENKAALEKLGFRFQDKSEHVVVQSVPAFLKDAPLQQFLPATLQEWATLDPVSAHDDERLSYLACRSAVKAGDTLDRVETERLLRDARQMDDIYTCPHGRPFKIKISRGELDKWFKRTGFE